MNALSMNSAALRVSVW